MKRRILDFIVVAILAALPIIGQQLKAQVPANCPDVMLQAFDYYPEPKDINGTKLGWNESKWTVLNTQAAEIGASFQMIWLPPSGNAGGGQTMGYLPVYWFNQNSTFGTQDELKTLVSNLKTNNCKAIADIVVNHRNGVADWCTFATESYKGITYTPNSSWICTDDESRTKAPAGCNNPQGNADDGEPYDAARDLDHKNSGVQAAIKAYLDFLKTDIGYSGWRYDVAAGFAPGHVGDYNDAAAGTYSVGEVLKCDYTAVETWINGTGKKSAAFDFPFQCSVRDAFNNNNLTKLVWKFLNTTNQPAGLIHNPDLRRYATTFLENHDTYRYGLAFTGNVEAANAFMLSSPGVPCVYLPHWKAYKTNIAKMIAARKKAGLHSQSAVVVLQTATNIYVGQATGTNGELIVKVGSGSYSAPAGYTQECSGTDWCIWTKTTGTPAPVLNINNPGGTYIGGTSVTLTTTSGVAPVKIYYTLNNTTPSAASTPYSAPINITNDNTVLQAIAIDNGGAASPVAIHTYFTTQQAGITVSFTAPASWTKVGCYAWKGTSTTLAGAWPGTEITASKLNGVYSFTITDVATLPINIVFNNLGNSEQTVDLSTSATICWLPATSTTVAGTKKYTATVTTCPIITGLSNETETPNISIYPNPASQSITIEANANMQSIQIYSINGILVKTLQVESNSQVVSITDLAPGFYSIAVITLTGARTTQKLIKQ